MVRTFHALSIKQPWAALVLYGLKTIEVRKWATGRRGLILIHAGRIADERREGWNLLPEEAAAVAERRGGILGAVELVDCITYRSLLAFAKDQAKHRNQQDWFEEPALYGFVFRNPRLVGFRKLPGWFRFFPVELNERDVLEGPIKTN